MRLNKAGGFAMKNDYTIHEIAKLYAISTDALRYYERLGLITPRRGENGYRLYSLRDIYRLTIIRDLRQLGFSMESIREYLEDLSLDNTLALLRDEEKLIEARQRELRLARRAIRRRMRFLSGCAKTQTDELIVRRLPQRPCVRFNADIRRDEEVDLAVKKLHNRHADTIRDLGGQAIGASMRREDIDGGIYGLYHAVFFLLEDGDKAPDFWLPGGDYACLLYRGGYRQLAPRVRQLLDGAMSAGRAPVEDVLELYHIDNRHTLREYEFLTELQVRLS